MNTLELRDFLGADELDIVHAIIRVMPTVSLGRYIIIESGASGAVLEMLA